MGAEFSTSKPRMNKIVYSQLSVATTDGAAHHLIKTFDDVKDGHKAWKALCEWYDGDAVKRENAEGIRVTWII